MSAALPSLAFAGIGLMGLPMCQRLLTHMGAVGAGQVTKGLQCAGDRRGCSPGGAFKY